MERKQYSNNLLKRIWIYKKKFSQIKNLLNSLVIHFVVVISQIDNGKENVMGLVICKNEEQMRKLKCTIQKSGRLGFTDATAKQLRLGTESFVQFATDDEDDNLFYLINNTAAEDDRSFKVCKTGEYYYTQAKTLFDRLNLDYEHNTIIFDMERSKEYSDMEVYKLKKRELPRKK